MTSLHRDARHLALKQVGNAGQQRIAAGSALLIGVGGIGCATATYLASSGIGRLRISDFDTVDETNLARQVLYTNDDIGALKADIAAHRLLQLNADIEVDAITYRMQSEELIAAVRDSDIVLDGSDNFATRFALSDACVAAQRRLISGSAIRLEGQLAIFGPDYGDSACYRCLYSEADESLDSCAGNGVLSPVPAVIGTMMAVEALKSLAGINNTPGKLTLYDAGANDFRTISVQKRDDCPTCRNHRPRSG